MPQTRNGGEFVAEARRSFPWDDMWTAEHPPQLRGRLEGTTACGDVACGSARSARIAHPFDSESLPKLSQLAGTLNWSHYIGVIRALPHKRWGWAVVAAERCAHGAKWLPGEGSPSPANR